MGNCERAQVQQGYVGILCSKSDYGELFLGMMKLENIFLATGVYKAWKDFVVIDVILGKKWSVKDTRYTTLHLFGVDSDSGK